jgi:hypothetical protein
LQRWQPPIAVKKHKRPNAEACKEVLDGVISISGAAHDVEEASEDASEEDLFALFAKRSKR